MPLNAPAPQSQDISPIAGSVLPISRAEELLLTLPGVVSARIIASDSGAVSEIHILAYADVVGKQMVRNVESALIAHLGMRVDHRKISIATTVTARATLEQKVEHPASKEPVLPRRRLYFEDIEVRRSRSKGVTCRVTLRRGDQSFEGEADGPESPRSRVELAARAALAAIERSEGQAFALVLDGCKLIEAFEREFVFVGITTRVGRETTLLTGSCENKESAETASVLAVLDATNRVVGGRG